MPSEKDKILEFKQYLKSDKMPFIICADVKSLIRKQMDAKIIQKNLQQLKMDEHIPCRYSMSTICIFDHIEDKHNLYREKDIIKKV